jgi:hypothetical protein
MKTPGDAEHRLHGVLELLERPVQLEVGLHARLMGNGLLMGISRLSSVGCCVAKPVDPLLVLADLQLHHVGRSAAGQPAGEILLIVGHPSCLSMISTSELTSSVASPCPAHES